MTWRSGFSTLSFAACVLAACGDGGGASTTSDPTDPPTPTGSCTPNAAAKGNAKHVGAYCSTNGGQCGRYDDASLACSIDLDPRGGQFCILLGCHTHADCGDDACCTGDPGVSLHACVPIGCLTDADGGVCPPIP